MKKLFDIIHLPDNALVVDKEAKITLQDHIWDEQGQIILQINNSRGLEIYNEKGLDNWLKIIASTKKIEGIPLLEIPEEDVNHLAEKSECSLTSITMMGRDQCNMLRNAFVRGYKAASKQYTEEDMYAMFQSGREFELSKDERDSLIGAEEALESLKPVPKQVELALTLIGASHCTVCKDYASLSCIDKHHEGISPDRLVPKVVDGKVIVRRVIYDKA